MHKNKRFICHLFDRVMKTNNILLLQYVRSYIEWMTPSLELLSLGFVLFFMYALICWEDLLCYDFPNNLIIISQYMRAYMLYIECNNHLWSDGRPALAWVLEMHMTGCREPRMMRRRGKAVSSPVSSRGANPKVTEITDQPKGDWNNWPGLWGFVIVGEGKVKLYFVLSCEKT